MPFSLRRNLRFGSRCDLRPSPAPRLPAATPDQHKSPATHYKRAAALEHGQDNPPRDQLGHQSLRDQGHRPIAGVPLALQAATHAGRAAFGRPCRCARARERPVRMLQVHARRLLPRLPRLCARREARRPPRDAQLALAISTCERAASPVLLTACALLPRCRQPQLRAVGLDGHRALDISATTDRRNVDSTVTTIRPPSCPRSPARPRRREACRLCNVPDGDGVGPNHARGTGAVGSARRHTMFIPSAGTMFIPSAGAPTAAEPSACACSSPRLPLVVPLPALTFIFTAHTTRTSPPATLAARFSSNARALAETRSSCLRAAIARTSSLISNLIGGIPRHFLDVFIARVQPSASTHVVTSLNDHSHCCDACSDRGLPAYLSARRRLPGLVRDLDTLCRG